MEMAPQDVLGQLGQLGHSSRAWSGGGSGGGSEGPPEPCQGKLPGLSVDGWASPYHHGGMEPPTPSKAHPLAVQEPLEGEVIPTVVRAWERMPRETDSSWALFVTFRDSAYPEGPGGRFQPRNLVPLAEALGLSVTYLRHLSSTFSWFPRAGSYDRALDAAKVEEEIGEAVRVRRRHLRLLSKARLYAENELDKLVGKSQDPNVASATPREIRELLDMVITKERLLQGEHTDHVLHEGEWKLEDLTLEELEDLDRIRKRAKGGG